MVKIPNASAFIKKSTEFLLGVKEKSIKERNRKSKSRKTRVIITTIQQNTEKRSTLYTRTIQYWINSPYVSEMKETHKLNTHRK